MNIKNYDYFKFEQNKSTYSTKQQQIRVYLIMTNPWIQ